MCKSIAELWNGNIEPVRISGKNNAEMQELDVLIDRNFNSLKATLTKIQIEILKSTTIVCLIISNSQENRLSVMAFLWD